MESRRTRNLTDPPERLLSIRTQVFVLFYFRICRYCFTYVAVTWVTYRSVLLLSVCTCAWMILFHFPFLWLTTSSVSNAEDLKILWNNVHIHFERRWLFDVWTTYSSLIVNDRVHTIEIWWSAKTENSCCYFSLTDQWPMATHGKWYHIVGVVGRSDCSGNHRMY